MNLALGAGLAFWSVLPCAAQFYPQSGGSHYPGSPLYGNGNSGQLYPGIRYTINGNPVYYNYAFPTFRSPAPGKVSSLMESRTNIQTKKNTTWEAPTSHDNKVEEEIENTQVDYGVDSKQAVDLIFRRAKQYYESHQYEKSLKLLDQLTPLLKKDKTLAPEKTIEKMRADINAKLGNFNTFKISGSSYRTPGKYSPVGLDNFTFSDPRFNPNSSLPGSLNSGSQNQIGRRNYYP